MPSPATTQADLEALADSLTASADAMHARLMRDLRRRAPDGAAPLVPHTEAQALFDSEVLLRQRASALYLDAARLAAVGLGDMGARLLDVAARAQAIIARLARIKDVIELGGELLGLAAAIASGRPERLAAPYEKVKHHLEAMALLE